MHLFINYMGRVFGSNKCYIKWFIQLVLEFFPSCELRDHLLYIFKSTILGTYNPNIQIWTFRHLLFNNKRVGFSFGEFVFPILDLIFLCVFKSRRDIGYVGTCYRWLSNKRVHVPIFRVPDSLIYNYYFFSYRSPSVFLNWKSSISVGAFSIDSSFIINKFFISSFNWYFSYPTSAVSALFRELGPLLVYSKYFDGRSFIYPIPMFLNSTPTNFNVFRNYARFNSLYAFLVTGKSIKFHGSSMGKIVENGRLLKFDSQFYLNKGPHMKAAFPLVDYNRFPYLFKASTLISGAEYFSNYLFTFSYESCFRFSDFLSIAPSTGKPVSLFEVTFSVSNYYSIRLRLVKDIISKFWNLVYGSRNFFFFVNNYYIGSLNTYSQILGGKDFCYDRANIAFGFISSANFDRITRRVLYSFYKNLLVTSTFDLEVIEWLVDDMVVWYSSLNADFSPLSISLANMHSDFSTYPSRQVLDVVSNLSGALHSGSFKVNYDLVECFFDYELHIFTLFSELFSFVSRD